MGNVQNITGFKKPKQPGAAAVCAAQPLVLRVVFVIFISFRVCRGLFNNWINYIDIVEYPPLIVIRDGGDDKSVCQPPSRSRSPRTHLLARSLSLDTRTSRAVSHEAELKYKIQYVHVFVCSAYTKNTLSYLLFLYWVVVGSSTICCVTSRCDEEDNEQKKKNKKRLSSLSLQDDLPTVLQSHHTSHVYTIQFISVFKLDKEKIKNVGCDLNKNFYHPRCKMQDGRVTADNWSVKIIVLIFWFVKCEYFLPSFLFYDS